MLVRLCSGIFKSGFSSMRLPDVQNGFRKVTSTRDQIAKFTISQRKQSSSRQTSISASLTILKPLTSWITTNCGKALEKGVPDNITCILKNLCVGQEAISGTRQKRTYWFKTGKEVWQDCMLSPCLFNLCTKHIMRNAGLYESQGRIKTARRNIKTSDIQITPL